MTTATQQNIKDIVKTITNNLPLRRSSVRKIELMRRKPGQVFKKKGTQAFRHWLSIGWKERTRDEEKERESKKRVVY